MPKSDLHSELRRSAQRTVESIRTAARDEADRLNSEADRRIAGRRNEVIKGKEAEYHSEARVAVAAARHAAMRDLLLAQTGVVERVLERARLLLPEATRSDAYVLELDTDLENALQFVEGDDALVRCSPGLEAAVRKALRTRPGLTIQADPDLDSGFIVSGAGGTVVVDGRLQTRIETLASTLAIEIHARLEEV